jgi:predicted regulator of Ras-like GTPase activity (Roadblock/LC7/MglB family)
MAKNMRASSNRGKSGLVGYFKGLFRKSETSVSEDSYGETDVMVAAPAFNPPPPVAIAPPPEASNGNGQHGVPGVEIPLQSILNGFPNELRAKIRIQTVGDLAITIALDKVLSQLGQGVVQVPFGDIRVSAPHVFASGIESDRVPVTLPLGEILSRLNPALLVRRTAQRQVEVPDEISSPFDARGQGLSLSVGNAQPVTPAAPRKPAPGPNRPVRGSLHSSGFTPPPAAPVSSPAAPIPFSYLKERNVPASRPPAAAPQARPAAPAPLAPAPRSHHPQPVAAPPPTAAPPTTAQPGNSVITTTLNALWESWPESLRREIVQNNLADAKLAMPTNFVEAALRQGRVVFAWKLLRSWIRPATAPGVSAHDALELELPLKVIAPLFIARKQVAAQAPTNVSVDEAIPNLFFGFPQPEAAPTEAAPPETASPGLARPAVEAVVPVVPAGPIELIPTAVAPQAPAPLGYASPPKPADTNYYIWDDVSDTTRLHAEEIKRQGVTGTEFITRYASPNEIVSRAAGLDGVVGALIALPDGLMVASRIPADMSGDTLAAFLPQIYSKVSQCTKELRLGELNNLNFTVGNVPWKIFRVNAIFFAAFGHAAQPLPTAELAALAVELDRKKK